MQAPEVLGGRYRLGPVLGRGGMAEVRDAWDQRLGRPVAVKLLYPSVSTQPDTRRRFATEARAAAALNHPHVVAVHDTGVHEGRHYIVLERLPGQNLADLLARHGPLPVEQVRAILRDVLSALSAAHLSGVLHRDIKPANILFTEFGGVKIADFGVAKSPDTPQTLTNRVFGTMAYLPSDRIAGRPATPSDDLYALGLTLWEMWTCRVPEPGYKPRAKPMRQQIMFDVPAGLSVDEIKQIFRCLSDDAAQRLPARHLRFFNPIQLTTNPVQVARERLDPGPPPGRNAQSAFTPGAQALLATFATNAPEFVGELIPLDRPTLSIGRRGDVDIVVPEATVSGHHANAKWQAGSWQIEDLGSTNGTYVEHTYERKKVVNLMHGGEFQLGELRLKLVSFGRESPHHKRARQYLARRDGLTGLQLRDNFLKGVDEEAAYSEWIEQPLSIARYEIRGPNRLVSDRPTILEMLAFRRAATRVIELSDMLLLSLIAVTAGRTGPLRFAVCMTGPGPQEARNLVEQVVGQVQGMLPEGLDLVASIARYEPGMNVRSLVDPT